MIPAHIIINITAESIALILMLFLLVSNRVQKSGGRTRKAFMRWNINLIALLITQLGCWLTNSTFFANEVPTVFQIMNYAFFVMDYIVYSLLYLSFYGYVTALIREKKPFTEKEEKSHRICTRIMVGNVVLLTVLFISSFWTGWFFRVTDSFVYYTKGYILIGLCSLIAPAIASVAIFRKCYLLGMGKSWLLFSYVLIPNLFLVIDFVSNLSTSYLLYAFIALAIYLEVDIKQGRELALKEADLAKREVEMTNMRVSLMMQQIQPHFLYNALSSISFLCSQNPKEAEAAINEFAGFLRTNLRSINSQRPIPFETELSHVENYLKIQKRRFLERMQVEYDIRTKEFRIPALAMQTIVENAVKYGVESRFEPTTIVITSDESADAYWIEVKDDGPGYDTAAVPSQDRLHLGIKNTEYRLKEMVDGYLEIHSIIGQGTTVRLVIPKKTEAQ